MPGNKPPLTKMYETLRGLWKLHNAGPDLQAKLKAREEASRKMREKYEFAQENVTKALTGNFMDKVEAVQMQEKKKQEVVKKLMMEKLSKVELNPAQIQAKVQGNMLDKWEGLLSKGGAGPLTKGGGGGAGGGSGAGGGGAAGPGSSGAPPER